MRFASIAVLLWLLSAALLVSPALGEETFLGTRSDGQRTVMLELFTATWCVGCPYADAAADRLLRVIGPERVSVVQYHVTPTDELKINESDARWGSYGDPVLPSLFLDGELKSVGASSYEETFAEYLSYVQESLQVDTPVSLELDFQVAGGSVVLDASVDSSESLAGENLFLRFALFENILEVDGEIYNYSVRAYNETSIDPASLPASQFMTFALDVTWIPENMGAVVFLQADSNGGIHQSANVMFGEPPAITIADTTADPVSGNHTVEGSCTSSRTLSGVFVQIDDGLWVEAEGTAQWIYTIDTRELSDGSHTVHARVYDIAGTYSLPDALTISVRNEEPMPSLEVILLLVAVLSVALFVGAVRRSRA